MGVLEWLREVCGEFVFDVVAVYRRAGDHAWSLVFLLDRAAGLKGAETRRETERGYPDIELSGEALGGEYPFRIGAAVQRQLDRLLAAQEERGQGRGR